MPFKIRTKLLVAFGVMLIPAIVLVVICHFNQRAIYLGIERVEEASQEMVYLSRLQLAIERLIMPANDYLVKGDTKGRDEFEGLAKDVEREIEGITRLTVCSTCHARPAGVIERLYGLEVEKGAPEEMEMLKGIVAGVEEIRKKGEEIFAIKEPIGSAVGARLMEEMDGIAHRVMREHIDRHMKTDRKMFEEAVLASQRVWGRSWVIMLSGAMILVALGVAFSTIYSNLFVKPIKTIHLRANSIARGNFKGALDIRTGDELEQLANSINEMAEKLDGFYSTLEEKVREKTRELRASEAKFKTLAEQSPNMIFINKRGSLVYANAKCEEVMKYKMKELYSPDFDFLSLIAPESVELIRSNLDKHQRGEEVEPYEYTIVSKDGKRLEIMLNSVLIDYEGEKAILGIMTDITERKKAEKDLKESEERFRTIFDNAIDGILLADVENKRFYTGNKSIGAMLGYTLEEIKSLGVADIHPGKDLPYVITQFERQARGEFTMAEDIPVKRKDGSVFYADINSIPISLAGKQYLMGIFRDISERKKMVESLKIEKDKLIKIFEAMEDGVYIVNQNYDIEYINPILEREYGPWKGIKCYTYFHDRTEVCPWCPNERVWAGETVRWEWFSFKNGKIYDLLDTPMRNPDGSLWKLEIFRDITDKKKAENDLKKRIDELEQFRKVTIKRELRMEELQRKVDELERQLGEKR